MIASNVRIAASKRTEDFIDTEDALAFFSPREIALSTAAHMSARFTYVSPAGSLVRDDAVYGHVVDGGYFENSGATTTFEILQTIDLLKARDKKWKRVEPVVVHISNEPVDPAYGADTLANARNNQAITPPRYLNEVLSPLSSLLNTRNARGAYARETVAWRVGWWHFLHFGLCRSSSNIPLGWVLSKSTRDRMEEQLNRKPCVGPDGVIFDNPKNLEKVRTRRFEESETSTEPGAEL